MWLRHANDHTPEFRLARSLASILRSPAEGPPQVGPVRENLEPVAESHQRARWNDGSTSFVWTSGDALSNLVAVLERRCLESRMRGLDDLPLASAYSAKLTDIVAFLNGGVDVQRMADLVLPLSFVRYRQPERGQAREQSAPPDLPTAYAAMKLTLLPGKFTCPEYGEDKKIRMEPQMLAMLRARRVNEAYRVAFRRLIASGLRPLSPTPGIADRSEQGRRLAAALLFPLDTGTHKALAERVLYRPPPNIEPELELVGQSSDS